LGVRDDGKGMDAAVLSGSGREGHYGLPGMKGRARVIGGDVAVWSRRHEGTEVELRVPARAAYAKCSSAGSGEPFST
jgi:signal transduction histidine kinase